MTLHIGRVSIIVDASLVAEDPLVIEEEDVRSADCAIFSSDLLSLVPEVWEVEALLFRARYHVFKTVFRVPFIIIAVDSKQTCTLRQIVSLQLNHSGLVSLHVGTVIATEDDRQGLFVGEALERVHLAVYSFQFEVYDDAAER